MKYEIEKIYLELCAKYDDENVTSKMIVRKLRGEDIEKKHTIIEIFERHNSELEKTHHSSRILGSITILLIFGLFGIWSVVADIEKIISGKRSKIFFTIVVFPPPLGAETAIISPFLSPKNHSMF